MKTSHFVKISKKNQKKFASIKNLFTFAAAFEKGDSLKRIRYRTN